MMQMEPTFIQERKYQSNLLNILKEIDEVSDQVPSVLIELDCGMGKRILSYLMVKKYFPKKKALILLQASTSLQETADFFINKYKLEVGVLTSRTPSKLRKKILTDSTIILATPQTLANTLEKNKGIDFGVQLILINEVDKIIRRTSTRRTLIYPYPKIITYFHQAWIIGLSGTLRDSHLIIGDKVKVTSELQTLTENLHNVRIITMEEIIDGDSNYNDYINYTIVKKEIIEDPEIENLFQKLDSLIKEQRRKIIKLALEEGLIQQETKNKALIASHLQVDPNLTGKYNAMLMVRKYISGMLPYKWKYFLQKFQEFDKSYVESLNKNSKKIQSLKKIIEKELPKQNNIKVLIMVSYVVTGETICKYLNKSKFNTFMISGKVHDKNTIINKFRASNHSRNALIMTSVGERDLDIPEAELIIVYDSINTLKTMYQRFKRIRGGKVVCLCYSNSSEEKKIHRVLQGIKERYPWSVKVEL